MKIIFDHQVFAWQERGGISRYFTQLQSELDKMSGVTTTNTTLISNNRYLQTSAVKFFSLLPGIYIPGKVQFIKALDKLYSRFMLAVSTFDIFHPTYYDDYFLSQLKRTPYVVTVFDMIHELYKQDFPSDNTSKMKQKLVRSAAHIIAISQSTKDDLVRLFRVPPSRVTVIHLASSLDLNTSQKVALPKRYILYIGDRGKYKNFARFAKSAHSLMSQDQTLHVVCVGGGSFTRAEAVIFTSLRSRFHQVTLGDGELVYAYSRALCLVVPSLYEGFGLPLLEAMQCGCPVVSSKAPSLVEVGGSAALYFDPKNETEMTEAVARLVSNSGLREKLTARGVRRAKQFSWSKCAQETLSVYRRIYRP